MHDDSHFHDDPPDVREFGHLELVLTYENNNNYWFVFLPILAFLPHIENYRYGHTFTAMAITLGNHTQLVSLSIFL